MYFKQIQGEEIKVGAKPHLRFRVSRDLVDIFCRITADFSALHTDEVFARRSQYRDIVVHGMLPLSFIGALPFFHSQEKDYWLESIKGKFLKPAFVEDELELASEILALDETSGEFRAEFTVKNTRSGALLTTGDFIVRKSEKKPGKNGARSFVSDGIRALLTGDPRGQSDRTFEGIHKNDTDEFRFVLTEPVARSYSRALWKSCGFSEETAARGLDNLLAGTLFSTFVGMRIPGKAATFMAFDVSFKGPLEYEKEYVLKGTVEFKSLSTLSIVEGLTISDAGEQGRVHATGRATAKVNPLASRMPSSAAAGQEASDLQLKGKIALVTGASRGLGETIAKLLSAHGAKVIVNFFRGQEDASRVVEEINAHGGSARAMQADVSDQAQVKKMMEEAIHRYGTIDILVNNAVRDAAPMSFMELSWDDFQKDIDVTVKGAFNCCREVLPFMLKAHQGKIINLSTTFTDNPPPKQTKYVTSKSALVGLTRSLAVEFASSNIQINLVVPSIVDTDLSKHVPKILMEGMKNETPMKRNASPMDVAKAVVFLASSYSSFTTGQRILVTGGNAPFL